MLGQLDVADNVLSGQVVANGKNASSTGSSADINALIESFIYGSNAATGEGWCDALARGLANQYFASALCSWYAAGNLGNLTAVSQHEAVAANIRAGIRNPLRIFARFINTGRSDLRAGATCKWDT